MCSRRGVGGVVAAKERGGWNFLLVYSDGGFYGPLTRESWIVPGTMFGGMPHVSLLYHRAAASPTKYKANAAAPSEEGCAIVFAALFSMECVLVYGQFQRGLAFASHRWSMPDASRPSFRLSVAVINSAGDTETRT